MQETSFRHDERTAGLPRSESRLFVRTKEIVRHDEQIFVCTKEYFLMQDRHMVLNVYIIPCGTPAGLPRREG